MNSKRHSAGMTLIELLMVVALVAVLAGSATTAFAQFYQNRMPEIFVKDLAAYLRQIQFKTIEEGKIHKLKVESEKGILAVYRQEKGNQFSRIEDAFSRRFESSPFSVRMNQGGEIYFFPDGTVTRNAVSVLSEDEKIATLQVKNRLGAIQVEFHD